MDETYAAGEKHAVIGITAFWNHARQAKGNGIAHAQCLVEHGFQIREAPVVLERLDLDVPFVVESRADLCSQAVQHLRIACEMVEDARQHRSRGIRASCNDEIESRQYLLPRHALETHIVLHKRRHEIRPLSLRIQTAIDLRIRVLGVAALAFQHALRDETLEEELEGWVVRRSGGVGHAFEVAEQRADPGMVFTCHETAEGFAKGQVSDHVHGEEVEPVGHVDQRALFRGIWCASAHAELSDELVGMLVD